MHIEITPQDNVDDGNKRVYNTTLIEKIQVREGDSLSVTDMRNNVERSVLIDELDLTHYCYKKDGKTFKILSVRR
jgi:hypothetical protein